MSQRSASTEVDVSGELARIGEHDFAAAPLALDPPFFDALARRVAAFVPGDEGPADLVARPVPHSSAAWHFDGLRRTIAAEDPGESLRARIRYHARWLGWLLFPQEERHRPLVSVVIPCYNGADVVREAVRCSLEQTWPRIEVVVVDDGSTDAIEDALADARDRMVLVRKENGGVASARNVGIRHATGDLLHFLDVDDVLDRDCVEQKMLGVRAIGDAEICISTYRSIGSNGFKHASTHVAPAVRGIDSPTEDLMITVVRRYAVHTSTVLAARWVLLEAGFFEEDLRQSEDTRYWFQLGLRGTKVIGIDRPLNTRRFVPGSLTSQSAAHKRYWGIAFLRNLTELIAHPTKWPYVGLHIRRSRNPVCWSTINDVSDAELERLRGKLLETIATLPSRGEAEGLTARPVLTVLSTFVKSAHQKHGSRGDGSPALYPRLLEAIEAATSASPPPSTRDVELWLEHPVTRKFPRGNRPALRPLFRHAHARVLAGDPALPVTRLGLLSRAWPGHPWSRRWWMLQTGSRLIGARPARVLVRRFERVLDPACAVLGRLLRPLGALAGVLRPLRRFLWRIETRIWEAESRPGIGRVVGWLKFVKKRVTKTN